MTATKDPSLERRAKKRLRADLKVAVLDLHVPSKVSTRDICAHGLSCFLPSPLSLFTKYRFQLFVPTEDDDSEEIDGEGIVVRVEEVEREGENVFQTAFFFQNFDTGHVATLENFLESVEGDDGSEQ